MVLSTLGIAGLVAGGLSGGAGILSGLNMRNRKVNSLWDENNYTGLKKLTDPMATWKAFAPQLRGLNQFTGSNLARLAAQTQGSPTAAIMNAGSQQRNLYDTAFANYMPAALQTSFQANTALAQIRQGYDLNAQNLTQQNYMAGQEAVMSGLNSIASGGFGLAGQDMGYNMLMGNRQKSTGKFGGMKSGVSGARPFTAQQTNDFVNLFSNPYD